MIRSRRKPWATLFYLLLQPTWLIAQEPKPSSPSTGAQIVRVAIGASSGLSGGGQSTTIEPEFVKWERDPSSDWLERGMPPEKRTCRISKQDWDALRRSIDDKTIAAFTGIKGCPACVDQPETWAALDFSDGTKKSVDYGDSASAEIAALLRRIGDIVAGCPSQLVMFGGADKPISSAFYAIPPTTTVEPVYPESAKAAGSKASVVVYVVVGRNGEVETVTAADGPEQFREPAIEAARQWKWEPHQLNGQPIRFRAKALVNFAPEKGQTTVAK